MNLVINNTLLEKMSKFTEEEQTQLSQALVYLTTDKTPNLPQALLELYKEIQKYNLAHNIELKKIYEANNEKK